MCKNVKFKNNKKMYCGVWCNILQKNFLDRSKDFSFQSEALQQSHHCKFGKVNNICFITQSNYKSKNLHKHQIYDDSDFMTLFQKRQICYGTIFNSNLFIIKLNQSLLICPIEENVFIFLKFCVVLLDND